MHFCGQEPAGQYEYPRGNSAGVKVRFMLEIFLYAHDSRCAFRENKNAATPGAQLGSFSFVFDCTSLKG